MITPSPYHGVNCIEIDLRLLFEDLGDHIGLVDIQIPLSRIFLKY